jgi:hypothetical protein
MKTKQFFLILLKHLSLCSNQTKNYSAFFKKAGSKELKKSILSARIKLFSISVKDMQNSNLFNYLLIKIKKNIFSQLK